jgi:predicted nuclease with RNAse H fold
LPSFACIDLTSSPNKPSAYALLGVDLRILSLQFLNTDSDIIAAVECDQPALVAIDAPLSLPRGLCCLKEDCLCQAVSGGKGRLCERDLARLGISSYFTTKRSIIKDMVYRAIELKLELMARGHEFIEVYPYASKVRLWGKPFFNKATRKGLEFLKERLSEVIPNVGECQKLDHDLCDAVIAAYTAYLLNNGKAEPIGDYDEGLIYVPCPHPGFPV